LSSEEIGFGSATEFKFPGTVQLLVDPPSSRTVSKPVYLAGGGKEALDLDSFLIKADIAITPRTGIPPEPQSAVAGAVRHIETPLGSATGLPPKKLATPEKLSINEFDKKVFTA
jgi:hypothetical protein